MNRNSVSHEVKLRVLMWLEFALTDTCEEATGYPADECICIAIGLLQGKSEGRQSNFYDEVIAKDAAFSARMAIKDANEMARITQGTNNQRN